MSTPPPKPDLNLDDQRVSPALRAVDLLAAYFQTGEPPADPLRLAYVAVFTLESAGYSITGGPK